MGELDTKGQLGFVTVSKDNETIHAHEDPGRVVNLDNVPHRFKDMIQFPGVTYLCLDFTHLPPCRPGWLVHEGFHQNGGMRPG